ncbi:MAG TPA: zinc-dependent metalloprotease [Ilumatobacteraceae bacterium]|nr:zinc-dependent metalloprotease [Ilumatobacteraceae bacterium]
MADGPGSDNPFENLPMFGDLARALAGQGPLNWDAARQFAALAATGGAVEVNIDPSIRIKFGELAQIAELHVRDLTGFDGPSPEVLPVTSGAWAQRTLEAYRPLFTELATSLGQPVAPSDDDDIDLDADPMMAMMANLSKMMAPSMMGMAVGSMVGRMATQAFGQHDLPIPRQDSSLTVLPGNIDRFAEEWSISADEMRMWVLAQELTGHALFSISSLREDFASLVRRHVGAFKPDPEAIAEKLSSLDSDEGDPMQAMQQVLSDPAVLLGAVQSAEQRELQPSLDAAAAAVVGYVDYMVDGVSVRVIGGDALRIAEAVRRRRVDHSADDLYTERLLGLRLTHHQVQRGKNFVAGVVDRVGEARLSALLARPKALPTAAEIDAPGLWVARLELVGE